MRNITWHSAVVAIVYLLLVGSIMYYCGTRAANFDEYSKYWGLFATIIGVATGAIPGYFFQVQKQEAVARAATAQEEARKATVRAELYAGSLDPTLVHNIRQNYAQFF